MNHTKAFIWDMDGVIADTAYPHFLSWQSAFAQRGINFSEEDFKHHFGQRNDTIIRDTMGNEITDDLLEAIAEDKEEFFRREIVKDLRPFPGVIDLLRELKTRDIGCAVASSAPLENVLLILKQLDIKMYFRAIVYGKEVAEGKPSPMTFQLAAKKLGVDPAYCIVIEDAVAGVKAARRAGMLCIAVTNTHPRESLAEADLVVDSLKEVRANELERLFNK